MTYVDRSSLTALSITLSTAVCLAFVLRVASQIRHIKSFGVDGALIIPAFIFALGLGVTVLVGARVHILGNVLSNKDAAVRQVVQVNQMEYAFYAADNLCLLFSKLSILFFFRRVFRGVAYRTIFDYCNWTLIALTTLVSIAFLLANLLMCGREPSALWDTNFIHTHQCVNTLDLLLAWSVSNFTVDLMILVEPFVVLSQLRMNRRKKIQASLVFLLSSFAVIAGLMRFIYFIQLRQGGVNSTIYTLVGLHLSIENVTAIITMAIVWTYMEASIAFIVACLLASAKMLDTIVDGTFIHRLLSLSSLGSFRSRSSRRSQEQYDSDEQSLRGPSERSLDKSSVPKERTMGTKVTTITQQYDSGIELSDRPSKAGLNV